MSERDLESLFLDFRERGDVAGLAQVFDRTSDELLTIALHLVPEPAQADDVVQATFLTAIQRAETFDNSRALMPWLVGILANQAARARQARAQSIDPSKLEPRVQPEPSDDLERAEVARILERAVDDLPEPYRAAVKRHVLDGERAVDIARQSGIAAGTVRMHILRGLEKLRRALPASLFAVGPWSVRGTGSVRAAVLEAARAKARILTASATTSTATGVTATLWSIGGLLMSIKILLAAGALVVAALFVWNLTASRTPPLESVVASPSGSKGIDALASAASHDGEPNRQAASLASAAAPPATLAASGWWLSGTVTGLGGHPAGDTTVVVHISPYASVVANCDKTGRFEIDVSPLFQKSTPSQLIVAADHPANRHGAAIVDVSAAEAEHGRSLRVDLACKVVMEPFALIKGRVETPSDVSHGEVQLKLYPADGHEVWPDMVWPTRPDPATGAFTVVSQEGGAKILRIACDGLLPCPRHVELVLGETVDLGLIGLGAGDSSIGGRVALPFASSTEHLRVLAFQAESTTRGPARYPGPQANLDGRAQYADVDESGRFRVTGLTTGEWHLQLLYGSGRMMDAIHVLDPPTDCPAPARNLVLGTNLGRIVVQARTHGVPLAKIYVTLRSDDHTMSDEAVTDERGCATFFADTRTDLALAIRRRGVDPVQMSLPSATRTIDMVQTVEVPELEHGTLVLEPAGRAPLDLLVTMHLGDMEPIEWGPTTKKLSFQVSLIDGKYTVPDVPSGRWKALVSPIATNWDKFSGGGEFLTDETLVVEMVAGETRTQPIEFRPAGRVRFEIDGWSGGEDSPEELADVVLVDANGRALPTLFATRRIEKMSLTAIPKDLKMVPTGPDAPPVGKYFIDTTGRSMSRGIQLGVSNELAPGLPPGDYRMTVDGIDWISSPVAFAVQAGAMTDVRISVRKR